MKKLFLIFVALCLLVSFADEPIFQAIKDNQLEMVAELAKTPQINAVSDENGVSPLMLAIQEAKPEMVKILVENGANMMQIDNRGLTALDHIWQFTPQYQESIHKEMSELKEIGFTDKVIQSLYVFPELPRTLVGKATELDTIQKYLTTIKEKKQAELFQAIEAEDVETVRNLAGTIPLNELGPNGKTPLMAAAFKLNMGIIKTLLENGANSGIDDKDGLPVCYQLEIMRACWKGNLNNIKEIELAWYQNNKSFIGEKVSEECIQQTKRIQMYIEGHNVKLLKELESAINKGNVPETRRLAKAAELNNRTLIARVFHSLTVLEMAAFSDSLQVVKILLDEGADIDLTSRNTEKETIFSKLEQIIPTLEKYIHDIKAKFFEDGMTEEELERALANDEKIMDNLNMLIRKHQNCVNSLKYLKYKKEKTPPRIWKYKT